MNYLIFIFNATETFESDASIFDSIQRIYEINKSFVGVRYPMKYIVFKLQGVISSRKIKNRFDDNYKFMITISKSTLINVMSALDVTGYESLL